MQRLKMFQILVKIDAGKNAKFKKKVVYPPQLIWLTLLIYHGKETWHNAPYKAVNKFMQNRRDLVALNLPDESRKILKIVTHSLG